MCILKIEAPWERYRKMLCAVFSEDEQVEVSDVERDGDDYCVSVLVYSHEKFLALDRALKRRVEFGNVVLTVDIFDMENEAEIGGAELFREVFRENPIVKEIVTHTDRTGAAWNYVCFRPEVVQFFDDDLTDVNGNYSGLAEDIAREIFEGNEHGVFFCTAAKDAE